MGKEKVHEINELNFDSMVTAASEPVLLDFTAPWCPPCRALSGVVERIAEETWGQVTVGSVDTDAHPGLGAKFAIRGLPTLVVLHRGKEVARRMGLTNEAGVRRLLAELVVRATEVPRGTPEGERATLDP